jgi:hypothetical protein
MEFSFFRPHHWPIQWIPLTLSSGVKRSEGESGNSAPFTERLRP